MYVKLIRIEIIETKSITYCFTYIYFYNIRTQIATMLHRINYGLFKTVDEKSIA